MTLNELEVGSLALMKDGRLAIVRRQEPRFPSNPVIYSLAGKAAGTMYKGPVEQFEAVVGLVDLAALQKANAVLANVNPLAKEPSGTDIDFFVPEKLKGIKIGDRIQVLGRRGPEVVTYNGYNRHRPRFPVSFTTDSGRRMKCPIETVVCKVA